jgi:hypothetical protein
MTETDVPPRPTTHAGELEIDPRFTHRKRQPGLDLLRALAIIVIVIYHAALFGFKLPSRIDRFGWIGVDLFFVLSGYLIGGQLLAPLARGNKISLGRFFARRALRVMPAYFVVLAVYFLLPSWREYPDMSQPLWKFLLSIQNIALHGGTAFSHAWSLAVEDQFYLVLPFLLLFLFRRPRAAVIVPCLLVVGGIGLRAFLAAQNPSVDGGVSFRGFQAWIYYPTWTRLDPLVCGVALAAIERFRPKWWQGLMNSVGRKRLSHRHRLRVAIPAHRSWDGDVSDLRRQPAAVLSSDCNSWRGLHRQYRVQRVLDSENRHPFRRAILQQPQHRAHVRARSSRSRDCCLRRCGALILRNRTTIPAIASPHCSTEVRQSRRRRRRRNRSTPHTMRINTATARTAVATRLRMGLVRM